jgi:hypothetical protein
MINELVQELRSYPAHYTAAHKAADALDKAEKNRSHMHYYACRLEDELVKAQLEIERLREHIAQQQFDIATLGQTVGRLREVLREIEWSNNSEWQSDRARAALEKEQKPLGDNDK